MMLETQESAAGAGRSPGIRWIRKLLASWQRRESAPTVIFCYDLHQGETPADWCRRHPDQAPPADAARVVWVLPERPLPRSTGGSREIEP